MRKIVNGIQIELTPEEAAAVQAEWDANDTKQSEYKANFGYQDKRRKAYPSVTDQLDMLYHAMETGEIPKATAWFNAIKEIKDNHPKPS